MRKTISIFVSLLTATAAVAEETTTETRVGTTIGADVVSQYIWRGQDCGSVSLQPTLGIDYKGFSVSAWGSVGLSDASDTKEFDLTIGYTVGRFNVGVTDYWFSAGLDDRGRYFKYEAHSTNHVFEANVGFDFGPVALQWFTNFGGNDGMNKDDKRAYSSYFELSAPFTAATLDWSVTAGFVPYATSYYSVDGFALTNLSLRATKDIRVTETFGIPIFAEIDTNPYSRDAYIVIGFTLQP